MFLLKPTDKPISNRVDLLGASSHPGAARLKLQFSAATNKNFKVIVMYQML